MIRNFYFNLIATKERDRLILQALDTPKTAAMLREELPFKVFFLTLRRLERKGLVSAHWGELIPGSIYRRRYYVSPLGKSETEQAGLNPD